MIFVFISCAEGNNTHERIFELVVNELSATYPGHIMSADKHKWMLISNGGWMVSTNVLHVSTTEYLSLLGTAIRTSGHTGKNTYGSFSMLKTVLSYVQGCMYIYEIEARAFYPF